MERPLIFKPRNPLPSPRKRSEDGQGNLVVLVTGDRNWKDRDKLFSVLDEFSHKIRKIIEGCARGADNLAEEWARSRGKENQHFPADWDEYGKSAGPIRNNQMLRQLQSEEGDKLVLAFHDDLVKSKGTKHMVNQAIFAGVSVYLTDSLKTLKIYDRV